jgi:hypothetical protein
MPFFLAFPNLLVHVLESRDWRTKLKLIPVGVVPLANWGALRGCAVLQIVANAFSKCPRVAILRAIGSNPVNVEDVYLFPLRMSKLLTERLLRRGSHSRSRCGLSGAGEGRDTTKEKDQRPKRSLDCCVASGTQPI